MRTDKLISTKLIVSRFPKIRITLSHSYIAYDKRGMMYVKVKPHKLGCWVSKILVKLFRCEIRNV